MEKSQLVQSVVTAHQILEVLAAQSRGLTLTDLSRVVDMTPSRVLRHLVTLLELQLVERSEPESVYRLGVGLVRLAEKAASQHDISRVAFPTLRKLNDAFGQATFLVRRQADRAMVWFSLQSSGLPHLAMTPGMSFSLSGSACGRLLLAFQPELPPVIPMNPDATNDNPDPLPNLAALKERLASTRLCFFDYIRSDRVSGLSCLAVPILDHNDRATAAIGVLGLWSKFDEMANTILGELLAGGAEVSRQLGSRLPWPAAPDRT